MLMNAAAGAHLPVLKYFYVMNAVMLLLVMILGGTVVTAKTQRRPFHPWAQSPRSRKILIIGLGLLWILDGLLQAQPLMATQFVHELLVPLLHGQPGMVATMMRIGMHVWRIHPLAWDLVAIWTQILLGFLILFGEDAEWRRIGLWVSIVWGFIVWVGGEGLGSLLSGGSWFVGSPGSVLLYVLAAATLLLPRTYWSSPLLKEILRKTIAGLWFLFALLQAWPGSGWWSTPKLATDVLAQAQMAQPGFISAPLYLLAHLTRLDPLIGNGVFVALFIVLAGLWALGRPSRLTWVITSGITFGLWWCGQDLGVFGGMGTDPNSGAILLLGLMVYADLAYFQPTREPSSHHAEPGLNTSA